MGDDLLGELVDLDAQVWGQRLFELLLGALQLVREFLHAIGDLAGRDLELAGNRAEFELLAAGTTSRAQRSPVTASMRLVPAATAVSETMRNRPMLPVLRTCVPPHNSLLNSPTCNVRTSAPYFSPNSATKPLLTRLVELLHAGSYARSRTTPAR